MSILTRSCLQTPSFPFSASVLGGAGQRGARWVLSLAVVSLAAFIGCQAPGMKLDLRPNSQGTPVEVGGLKLSLHSITPSLLAAQANKASVSVTLEGLLMDKPAPYRIGPQDVILVTVWDHPEISLPMGPNRTDSSYGQLVDEKGLIFFPYVGKLKVSGLSTGEMREVLTAQLEKTIRNPQVDVKVLVYRSQKVYVGGEVKNPGVYAVTDVPFTLFEAVNRAGGLLPTADDSQLVLVRGSKAWRLNFQSVLSSGGRLGQIILQDGDTLQIPSASDSLAYMMGELVRPGNIQLGHGNRSLAKAISEAGGLQVTSSDATSIYVIRSANTSNAVDVFHMDARNPAAMVLADRFALNPGDIVYVDSGSLVRFNRVMNLLLPSISAATNSALAAAESHYFIKYR